jgi:hypothetical protein
LITVDKLFHLHNKIRTIAAKTSGIYEPTSPLYYLWTVPYLVVIGYIGLNVKNYVIDLPGVIKKQLIFAAGLFVSGAIFLELTGLYYSYSLNWRTDVNLILIRTAEELLQMLGLIMLIYTLTNHREKLK